MSVPARRGVIRAALVALLAGSLVAVSTAVPAGAARMGSGIVDRLESVDGLTVVSELDPPAEGYRSFVLTYRQPVDHRDPTGPTFDQRFRLLHRDTAGPMVLHTTGYSLAPEDFRAEPTTLLGGNQISVEHRFFGASRPQPADWSTLTIWQAATDQHTIVRALAPIYSGNWISTGVSKGAMASVYHRRFYPQDVHGVVAYGAPNDVYNREDSAYDAFFASVGTPHCRQALKALQREALTRRADLVERLRTFAENNELTFDEVLGSVDRAFEKAVLDTAWTFWQYRHVDDCAGIPPKTASDEEIFDYLDSVTGYASGFEYYSDQFLRWLAPYYYQSATQTGWPEPSDAHLHGLLRYPGLGEANASLPERLRSSHDPWPMIDVDRWVRTRSSRMLFVYGENDPWGAEPFRPTRRDSYTFIAPGGNHDADIGALAPSAAERARAVLRRWAGARAAGG